MIHALITVALLRSCAFAFRKARMIEGDDFLVQLSRYGANSEASNLLKQARHTTTSKMAASDCNSIVPGSSHRKCKFGCRKNAYCTCLQGSALSGSYCKVAGRRFDPAKAEGCHCQSIGAGSSLGGHKLRPVFPVTVVAPLMVQTLEVRADPNSSSWNSLCHSSSWKRGWGTLQPKYLNPFCFDTNFGMTWDNKKHAAHGHEGVQVRPRGGERGFAAMTNVFGKNIWKSILAALVNAGYERGTNLIGHQYDFRLSVAQFQEQTFPILKQEIENIVFHMQRPSVVTSMSMGGPYFHAFLQWVGPEWKQENIQAFVPLDGPFNGAASALQVLLGGFIKSYDLTHYTTKCPTCNPPLKETAPAVKSFGANLLGNVLASVMEKQISEVIRTFPSVYWMLPKVDTSQFPPEDPIVVSFSEGMLAKQCLPTSAKGHTTATCGASKTGDKNELTPGFLSSNQCGECFSVVRTSPCPEGFDEAGFKKNLLSTSKLCCKRHVCEPRTYRASEIPALLRDIGHREQAAQMAEYALSQPTTEDPGVPVHCIFGSNVQTPAKLEMESNFELKSLVLASGDQTVGSSSLRVCERWNSTVKTYELKNVRHGGGSMLFEAVDVIVSIALNDTATWKTWATPEEHWQVGNSRLSLAPRKTWVDKTDGPGPHEGPTPTLSPRDETNASWIALAE